jgi:coatomer subunit delta
VLIVDEKVSCQLKKDGGLESMEVQGTMQLEIHNDEDAFCRVQVAPLPASVAARGVQFKTHPNIDKALHASSNLLALKDASRPFPTGSALGILKWRCAPKEESAVPLTVNCWPSISGAQSYVSIEYECAAFDLHNVVVVIPLPQSREPPAVTSCDGDYRADVRKGTMTWTIDLIDEGNRSGSMEFSVPAADASAFFPIDISFTSKSTYCGVEVGGVVRISDGAPVKYTCTTRLSTDGYTVL